MLDDAVPVPLYQSERGVKKKEREREREREREKEKGSEGERGQSDLGKNHNSGLMKYDHTPAHRGWRDIRSSHLHPLYHHTSALLQGPKLSEHVPSSAPPFTPG